MEKFLWVEKHRPTKVDDCILPTNLKLMDGNYDVDISSKNISHLKSKNKDVEYWVAIEPESSYE